MMYEYVTRSQDAFCGGPGRAVLSPKSPYLIEINPFEVTTSRHQGILDDFEIESR